MAIPASSLAHFVVHRVSDDPGKQTDEHAKLEKSMTITELVKNKKAHFVHYREGHFIYETDDGFQFPVPLIDIGTATLLAEDKALFFICLLYTSPSPRD